MKNKMQLLNNRCGTHVYHFFLMIYFPSKMIVLYFDVEHCNFHIVFYYFLMLHLELTFCNVITY
jgi:hypothetical protein